MKLVEMPHPYQMLSSIRKSYQTVIKEWCKRTAKLIKEYDDEFDSQIHEVLLLSKLGDGIDYLADFMIEYAKATHIPEDVINEYMLTVVKKYCDKYDLDISIIAA